MTDSPATAPNTILWCDLETTGLDPHRHKVLEVGFLVTDMDLVAIDSWTAVMPLYKPAGVDPYVEQMHTDNGLWDECAVAKHNHVSIATLQGQMVSFIERHFPNARHGAQDSWPRLGGSSVHFDHGFIEACFPRVAALLHYRHIDVSTLKELWRMSGRDSVGENGTTMPVPQKLHRVIPDLDDTLAEAGFYLDLLGF